MSWSLRRAFVALAAVAAFGTVAFLQNAYALKEIVIAPGIPIKGDPSNPGGGDAVDSSAVSLPKADPKVAGALKAIPDYVQNKEWEIVIRELQKLIDIKEDVFAEVERVGADGKLASAQVSVRSEANRIIANLPKDGLAAYKLARGAEADALLKEAKAKSDPAKLGEVMKRYLHTDAGLEATNLLGTYMLDRGDYTQAALCFERLFGREGGDKLPPNVLYKALYAFQQTGDKTNINRVKKQLDDRNIREIAFGGKSTSVDDLMDSLARIGRAFANATQWDRPMPGGNPTRTAQGVGGTAFLEPRWKSSTVRTEETKNWLKTAENYMKTRGQPMLPAFEPLAITCTKDDKKLPLMVYRSYWGLHAVDVKTGKLQWETPSAWSVDRMVRDNKKAGAITQWVGQYMGNQQQPYGGVAAQRPGVLFENSTIGTLSSDGSLVFAVEDLHVPPAPVYGNYGFDGNPNSGWARFGEDVANAVQHSRLQAFDLITGKLRWEVGKRSDVKSDLHDCYFLGAPLPVGGKLYILTEKNQALKLLCLEAGTGKLISAQELVTTKEKLVQDSARRTQAAHLAFGEGILVCTTNAGAVLGIDPLTNSFVWARMYREKGDDVNWDPRKGGAVPPGWIMDPNTGRYFNPNINNQWKVSPPVITDGKVLFAAPDAKALFCLNLRDGTPLWTQKRQDDDLYLGGVYSNRALVVGKKTVRGIDLTTGETAFGPLPTGVPSGFGIASENVYYLPIKESAGDKEPEICAINVEKGIIEAHTKSRKKEVPGNLLFYEGDVLSQSLTEVVAFPQLAVKLAEIDKAILANPKDPHGLIGRAELRLDKGMVQEAIDDLRTAMENKPDAADLAKGKEKLYESYTEFFQRDFNKAEVYLKDYEELCQVESGKDQPEQRKRRANFLCLVAKGKEAQGKLIEAFEKYQEFGTIASSQELISVIDEPTVKAAPDVWSQGRIAAMMGKAKEADKKPLEDLLAKKWEELKKDGTSVEDIKKFVAVFGVQFAVGRDARLYLADKLMESNDAGSLLLAEQQLALLRGPNATRESGARAVEALARLYTRKGLLEDAAYSYRTLNTVYGDVKVRDGKTGSDIYNDLATDKRLLPLLGEPARVVSAGKIKVHEERGGYPYNQQIYHFDHAGEALPYFQRHRVSLLFNYHQLKITDRVTGEDKWPNQRLTQTQFQNLIYGNHQPGVPAPKFSYQTTGHLIVLPLGHMVFGLDPINKKILWEKNLYGSTGQPNQYPPGYNQLTQDPKDGSIQLLYPDGWMQRLGQTGPLDTCVVPLQTRDGLVAIDPLSGRTLWTRQDVDSRAFLFGDEQYIYVVERGSENSPGGAKALRAHDGVTVKEVKDFGNQFGKRIRLVGRNILLTDTDAKGQTTLRLYDVAAGKDLWSETFAANSVPLRTDNEQHLAGMVEPDGKVRVFDLRTQKEVLKARMDPKHFEKVTDMRLMEDGANFYVLCNGAADPNVVAWGGVQTNLMPGTGMRGVPVNGYVYAFARETGKIRWYDDLPNQQLVVDQFDDLPMALFTSRYNKMVANGAFRNVMNVGTLVAIDKRTGKRLYNNENLANSQQFHELKVDAKTGRIDFINYQLKVTFQLNADTASGPAGGTTPGAGSTQPGSGPQPRPGRPGLPGRIGRGAIELPPVIIDER